MAQILTSGQGSNRWKLAHNFCELSYLRTEAHKIISYASSEELMTKKISCHFAVIDCYVNSVYGIG